MMQFRVALATLTLMAVGVSSAAAQGFGVMESAETIQRGNVKLVGYPMIVRGENGAGNELGLVLRGGYGVTDRFDAELGAAFWDSGNYLEANAELWLLRAVPGTSGINFSVCGGVHLLRGDGADGTGLDLSGLLSTRITPRAELLGALDYTQTFYDNVDGDFSTLHLVPGVEYGVSRNLDFLAEFGVALNDRAPNYFAVGLA